MPDEETTETTDPETETETTTPDPKDAKIAALTAESVKYHKRAQEAENRIRALEGKVLADDDRALFETLKVERAKAEEESAKAAGKYDELLAKKDEVYKAKVAAAIAERDNALSAFESVAVKVPLQTALAAAGVGDVGAASHLIQTLHPHRAKANLVNGAAVVQVVDAQGNPVIDAECKPDETIGIEKLVAEFLATSTGKHFLPPSGDTGSGAHRGGEAGPTAADLLSDPEKKAAYIAKHGGEAFLKITSASARKK